MILRYFAATAIGTLAIMVTTRDKLFHNNLVDSGYGVRKGEKISCEGRPMIARTEDGTCNFTETKTETWKRDDGSEETNVLSPLMGAANIPFGRNVARSAVVKENKINLLEPNPIAVSRELLSRKNGKTLDLPLNLLLTAWIQFQNHDWFDHSNTELDYTSYIKVPVPATHAKDFNQNGIAPELASAFNGGQGLMLVPKTKDSGMYRGNKVFTNQVTHWWDASPVYGSGLTTALRLRAFQGGRLAMDEKNMLPLADADEDNRGQEDKVGYRTGFQKGIERTGFVENWWTGMSLLHNLFARNHNLLVADKRLVEETKEHIKSASDKDIPLACAKDVEDVQTLKGAERGRIVAVKRSEIFKDGKIADQKLYDCVLDQLLYDRARLINTALIAKIHTIEWTPAAFDTTPLDFAMRANWYGIAEGQVNKSQKGKEIWEKLRSLAQKVGLDKHTKEISIAGLFNSNRNYFGQPFTLTEEFTTAYRLHSLLPEIIQLRGIDDRVNANYPNGFPVKETRLDKSKGFYDAAGGFGPAFYSFGHTKAGQVTLGNYPKFLQDLEVPILGKIDMGAIDILRDRERGVPRYNEFRRQLMLSEIVSFNDLFAYRSNLQTDEKECDNLPRELRAAAIAGAKTHIVSFFSDFAWEKKHEHGDLTQFDRNHCKLQKMQARVEEYKEEFKKDPHSKKVQKLQDQILADIKLREAGLTAEDKVTVAKLRSLYNAYALNAHRLDYQQALMVKAAMSQPDGTEPFYKDNVEALDVLVGGLAETSRNPAEVANNYIGLGLTETPFQIFVLMASRRLMTDRFFAEDFRPEVYTNRGIELVRNGSMKGVIACNLRKEIPNIDEAMRCTRSAFHPWNAVGKLSAGGKIACKNYITQEQKDWANVQVTEAQKTAAKAKYPGKLLEGRALRKLEEEAEKLREKRTAELAKYNSDMIKQEEVRQAEQAIYQSLCKESAAR